MTAKNNKVITYRQNDGKLASTGVSQEKLEAVRAVGRLVAVRRVRLTWGSK